MKGPSASPRLIDLSSRFRGPLKRGIYNVVGHPLEALLSIKSLNRAYAEYTQRSDTSLNNFFADVLRYLNVSYDIGDEDLARIPKEGPVLIVANHPLGGLDGVVLGDILSRVRPDVRIMANSLLWNIREIRPWLITVNPFGGKEATKQNIRGMKQTVNWLRNGGCVGTFPSGTVSHLHLRQREVTDPKWSPNTARFVHLSKANVLPIHFEGKNSAAFHLVGLIHPLLRTAMLPREMMNKLDASLRVRVGQLIPYRKLEHFDSDERCTEFLRLKTYVLRKREENPLPEKHRFPLPIKSRSKKSPTPAPIATEMAAEALLEDVEALPEKACIVKNDAFSVFFASASKLPNVLQEIGRLREKTFRAVQEGTGKERDLDRYDAYYEHLFMWDHKKHAIVGAYRMGRTDEILKAHGTAGLYTSTLFKFKAGALDYFNPGFEMGRSFIVPEYQKKHASLVMLWKGIMRIVAQNPEHHILFGPVSITHEYNTLSKDMMVQFLRNHNFKPEIASQIKAKNPPKRASIKATEKQALNDSLRDIDEVSALISEIEMDRKGVPTLLRHYLKLKGQLLSFNVDAEFGQCLDGLIMVDFTRSNNKLLKQYMGPEHWERFASYHGIRL